MKSSAVKTCRSFNHIRTLEISEAKMQTVPTPARACVICVRRGPTPSSTHTLRVLRPVVWCAAPSPGGDVSHEDHPRFLLEDALSSSCS